MTASIADLLLWLFVVDLGIATGAGLYEARVVVPLWGSAPPRSVLVPDSGRRFWGFTTTVPLTLLAVANLFAALRAPDPQHDWWLAAVVIALVERALTFSYFIPTLLRLQRSGESSGADAGARLARWARVNLLRNALTIAAWLIALRVTTLPRG
ncbi:MAG TPA: hypothetical protein VF041_03270 [Gemmatimonadaceae bacterium]